MIAVIFELWPKADHRDAYLDIAARIKPELEALPGFISVERFESLTEPGKLLSLSFFEDERALESWRNLPNHRGAQTSGRDQLFADYRLRVAGVIRDYGMFDRAQAPDDSVAIHDTPDNGQGA
ncbi:antibiotic biosynthesis monooxygenase [Roseobacter sp. HKCCD9010]|uniref:antibiotic biosynthesis monooxygenase family protein n=1 Tax=unclassified Roseobacter TaxID=196798 RepID=UPI001490CAD7|nr:MULTISPECIES: antibiotic biosynthesis monooxygenase [unclassified Roseobacter]MBF9049385.1 antibiotic biosynthesis monooxygenase [Rhodobacterales bacterium HKCCD4356]NNV11385.1 antibiotic biosynthesis monooxygenase [Roseobacter sp. HKCCD7357]NNV15569.1 antibiotic biosynthesis monooxygenase [Roseobacter sp. HKCCD8768]NNV25029.1 antibiotic biosynthesis monooxygenase [Roseobacter sp. HKCCD8192]NNV29286.1 antibiotic biosynthesis monooxygenase [Roseobacter sp. HKCCD9061]